MPKLRKLKVILLGKHQDSVHIFLCKLGVSQYIKVDCNKDSYLGILQACPIPEDSSDINLALKTRIKKKCEEFDLKLDEKIDNADPLPGNTIDEILFYIDEHLANIEENLARSEEDTNSQSKNLDVEKRSIKDHPDFDNFRSTLLKLYKMTQDIDVLLEAKSFLTQCDTIIYFETWVVKKFVPKVKEGILDLTDGKCVIVEEKTKLEDNEPIIVKQPPFLVEGFSSLARSLGYPRKREINPTYLIALTFPFLFGIMFADVGQGAILFILGLFLLIKRRKADFSKTGQMYGFLLRAAGGMTLCGIASMIFGFLFGEFFGPSGVIHPVLLFEIGPFKFGGFDPIHEPLTMLRFSVLLGVSFISGSLFLSLLNHLIRGEFARSFSVICWMWFLIGGFFMWVYWGGISNITIWFGEGLLSFAVLVIAPLVLMFLVVALSEGFMDGFNHTIEVFIETLSHTLSFCRVAALFLTHAALNSMFLELGGVKDGNFPPISIPLIIVGTILNLSIEGLLVMVHVLRLHWVELLPKFYSGKGTPFKPIMIK